MIKSKMQWQIDAGNSIKDEDNIILSAPTGAGKTLVFMEWALSKGYKIIITSPIKALSSQRFRELSAKGYVTGLETGDVKFVPENWQILCCTNEIYTLKYISEIDVTVIMDEFHYCFENEERCRAFIDGLIYSYARNICICSATLGGTDDLLNYLNRVSGRRFFLCVNSERITELLPISKEGKISLQNIHNALIVAFSVDNCSKVLDYLAASRRSVFYPNKSNKVSKKYRKKLASKEKRTRTIEGYAKEYNVSGRVVANAELGLALFHGKILPKEKDFISKLFENELIDTVVGTDALSIGVNFPVEKVVFCQLVKYPGIRISRNMFDQISGRAGRKGYFDTGYFGYCDDLEIEFRCFDTAYEYHKLMKQKNEQFKILLTPKYDDLLQEKITVDDEVSHIVKYSSVKLDKNSIKDEVIETLGKILDYPILMNLTDTQKDSFLRFIPFTYFNEYTAEENCDVLFSLLKEIEIQDKICARMDTLLSFKTLQELSSYLKTNFNKGVPAKVLAEGVEEISEAFVNRILAEATAKYLISYFYVDVTNYYLLLKLRKYVTSLPISLRSAVSIDTIEEKINSIDETALNYAEFKNEENI
ncbi:MAG: DEAD/DEAH box helicase [Clostridia bacterium]